MVFSLVEFQLLGWDQIRMLDFFRYLRLFVFAATLALGGCSPGPGVEPPMNDKTMGFDAGAQNGKNAPTTGSAAGAAGRSASLNGGEEAVNDQDAGKNKADAE
jgi:hypothetical protein